MSRKTYTDTFYDLPSSVLATDLDRKRTPSFGIGPRNMNSKASKTQNQMPPPGHYRVKSTFEMNRDSNKGPGFGASFKVYEKAYC